MYMYMHVLYNKTILIQPPCMEVASLDRLKVTHWDLERVVTLLKGDLIRQVLLCEANIYRKVCNKYCTSIQ